MRPGYLLLLALLVPTHEARASHPYTSDDTSTLGTGTVEIELSGQATGGDQLGALGVGLVSNLGVLDWLDVAAAVGYGMIADGDTWVVSAPPPNLSVKLGGRGGGLRPSLGVRLDYQPAAGGQPPSGHDAALIGLASWERGRFAIHVNGGARHHVASDGAAWSGYAGTRVTVAASPRLTVGAELGLDGVTSDLHGVDAVAGLAWQLRAARVISVGLGASAGPERGGAGWFASFGYTAGFGGG